MFLWQHVFIILAALDYTVYNRQETYYKTHIF